MWFNQLTEYFDEMLQPIGETCADELCNHVEKGHHLNLSCGPLYCWCNEIVDCEHYFFTAKIQKRG